MPSWTFQVYTEPTFWGVWSSSFGSFPQLWSPQNHAVNDATPPYLTTHNQPFLVCLGQRKSKHHLVETKTRINSTKCFGILLKVGVDFFFTKNNPQNKNTTRSVCVFFLGGEVGFVVGNSSQWFLLRTFSASTSLKRSSTSTPQRFRWVKVGDFLKGGGFFPSRLKKRKHSFQKLSCMDNVSSKQGKIFAKSAWKVQKSVKENDSLLFICYFNFWVKGASSWNAASHLTGGNFGDSSWWRMRFLQLASIFFAATKPSN